MSMSEIALDRRTFLAASAVAAAGAGVLGNTTVARADEKAPETATGSIPADGQYITSAISMHGPIDVLTVIADGQLAQVRVLSHNESRVIGEHAAAVMPQRIVESQCLDVDTVLAPRLPARPLCAPLSRR